MESTLKRQLDWQAVCSAKGSDRILLSCWNKVLPEEVMQMCKNRQYDIATWITSNDRLLLLEASD
eukprot:m.137319 g.137319  ORF g.137319 m.137319 type:complete len:65 (-) comp16051_c0_seq7:807-1001(-)